MGKEATKSRNLSGALRRSRLAVGLASLAALAASTLVAAPTGAQSIDSLNAQIAGAQSQAEQLAARIDARSGALTAASERAQVAAQREADLTAILASGEEREAELTAEVAVAEDDLDAARQRLERAIDALSDRLVAIYKSGVPDAVGVLLDADGFDDLVTRADLLDRIQSADAKLIARVRELRSEVAERLAEVTEARQRAQAFNARIAEARSQMAAARADAEAEAAALVAARERQQAALAELRSQVGEWTQQVRSLEQVSAQQAQQTVADWVGDWAIPQSIVTCESGGNFQALNPSSGAGGAYQIMPSTWRAYGGSGLPHEASPGQQHRIAAQIWRDSGSAAWVC